MKLYLPLIALLALAVAACSSSTGTTASNAEVIKALLAERDTLVALQVPPPPGDTLISMNRTLCYGTCPAYALVIQGDGSLYYNGHRFVDHTGRNESKLDPTAVAGLLRAVKESGILAMPDTLTCGAMHTDAPSALLAVRVNGVQKQINHYHGCTEFPEREALLQLEHAIDSIVNVRQWLDD